MKNNLGNELIFIISLPRSGSTLLQHILASHSKIGSSAEPWILLHQIFAIKPNGIIASYSGHTGQVALTEFIEQIDDGYSVYNESIRKMALHLYRAYLKGINKDFFLDKTSRNYLILPELFKLFI